MDETITVFISYSHQDKAFARKLTESLESQAIAVWFDERKIRIGDSITDKIEQGLKMNIRQRLKMKLVFFILPMSCYKGWQLGA